MNRRDIEVIADMLGDDAVHAMRGGRLPAERKRRLADELPANFRRAAMNLHPDLNTDDPLACERFHTLVECRRILESILSGDPEAQAQAVAMEGFIKVPSDDDVLRYGSSAKEPTDEDRKWDRRVRHCDPTRISFTGFRPE